METVNNPQTWEPGTPRDREGAFAVIYRNGQNAIVWDGTKPEEWNSVIAWTRLPAAPVLKYNPKAFQEPDYGLWVGEYSYR
jgi:hypothetical protein